jgi:hypothetical protein
MQQLLVHPAMPNPVCHINHKEMPLVATQLCCYRLSLL